MSRGASYAAGQASRQPPRSGFEDEACLEYSSKVPRACNITSSHGRGGEPRGAGGEPLNPAVSSSSDFGQNPAGFPCPVPADILGDLSRAVALLQSVRDALMGPAGTSSPSLCSSQERLLPELSLSNRESPLSGPLLTLLENLAEESQGAAPAGEVMSEPVAPGDVTATIGPRGIFGSADATVTEECTAAPTVAEGRNAAPTVLEGATRRPRPRSGLSGPEVRRTTSGASGCRGGLQRKLRSQLMSPCRVPSCRSPVYVFAYSCAPPPTSVPAPIHLRILAAIASEELARQVQKQLSIKERAIITSLSHCSGQSSLWWFIGVKFSLIAVEAHPPRVQCHL